MFPSDVDAGERVEWLADLRRDGARVELPAGVTRSRRAEAAPLLGITRSVPLVRAAAPPAPATGNGKARASAARDRRSARADRAVRGYGPETVNHYVRAVRGFFRWLVKAKRHRREPARLAGAGERRRGRAARPAGTDRRRTPPAFARGPRRARARSAG